jgi:hypothetical protein
MTFYRRKKSNNTEEQTSVADPDPLNPYVCFSFIRIRTDPDTFVSVVAPDLNQFKR